MLIISYAWTTAALLAVEDGHGVKTCTRRSWNENYARMFRAGMEVQGWDRSPRSGGQQIAVVSLTADPYLERTGAMPDADYEKEGLGWMERRGVMIRGRTPREFWESWKDADELVYVVRFQVMKRLAPSALYLPGGIE